MNFNEWIRWHATGDTQSQAPSRHVSPSPEDQATHVGGAAVGEPSHMVDMTYQRALRGDCR